MSHEGRCVICDNFPTKVTWNDQEKGYVCTACEDCIYDALREFYSDDDQDLGRLADLAESLDTEVEETLPDSSGRRKSDTPGLEDGLAPLDGDSS